MVSIRAAPPLNPAQKPARSREDSNFAAVRKPLILIAFWNFHITKGTAGGDSRTQFSGKLLRTGVCCGSCAASRPALVFVVFSEGAPK
jgi:hypothetical protein